MTVVLLLEKEIENLESDFNRNKRFMPNVSFRNPNCSGGGNKKTGRMGERLLHFNTSIVAIDAAKVDFDPFPWRIGFIVF